MSNDTKRSAEKVLQVLTALGELGQQAHGRVRLADLVTYTGYPRPTVHRLLNSLKQTGFVVQDPQQRYQIGPQIFILSAQGWGGQDLRHIAHPLLLDLVAAVGHTAHLGIRNEHEIVYIDKIEPTAGVRVSSMIGQRRDLTVSALGKAILARLPASQIDAILAQGWRPRTPKSKTTVSALLASVDEARQRGFAMDDEESDLGIRCVAAAITDRHDYPLAAISLTTLSSQVNMKTLMQLGQQVRATAVALSQRMA